MIEQCRRQYPLKLMCHALELSRSGYYAQRKRPASMRTIQNRRLQAAISASYQASHQTYGSPRIHADLRDQGFSCSLNRVAHLMQVNGIRAVTRPRRRAPASDSQRESPVAPNRLNRSFAVGEPNRIWLGDITDIETGEGTLYLSAILDLGSRLIVGWSMDGRRDQKLVYRALDMALGRRRPPEALLHHTDQGSQYGATNYQMLMERHRIVASMSRRGNPRDNAPMESWIRTLKVELINRMDLTIWREVKEAIAEWIELFYNTRRRHSALGYLSPAEYERKYNLA